jgi:IclR family pca regulon transcriptional regulator
LALPDPAGRLACSLTERKFELNQITKSVAIEVPALPRVNRTDAERRLVESAGPEFLEALARGLRVIEVFGRDRQPLALSEVARAVDLPRASVRRTLATLVQLGYAETDGRLFRLTPRILTLATSYLSSNPLLDIVQPALERLSAEVNEGCSCAVLDGDDVVMIAHASPKRLVALSAQIGLRLPVVSSSLGRVLLAAFEDRVLDQYLARIKPAKLTPATVTDKARLRRAIVKARTDGYALVDQEVETGFRSISVPLRRLDGKAVAALNVGAHSERCSLDTMRKSFLPNLVDVAGKLRQQLV